VQEGAAHKAMQAAGAPHVQPAAPAPGRFLGAQAQKRRGVLGNAWDRIKGVGAAAAEHLPPSGSFGRKALIGAGVATGIGAGVGLAHHFGRKEQPQAGVQ